MSREIGSGANFAVWSWEEIPAVGADFDPDLEKSPGESSGHAAGCLPMNPSRATEEHGRDLRVTVKSGYNTSHVCCCRRPSANLLVRDLARCRLNQILC